MTSTVGRLVVDVLTNQSGGAVALGDLVYVDTAHDTAFTTGTTSAYTGMIGVCIEANGIASATSGRIQLGGHCAQVNLNASGTRGHYIKSHTVAKQATDAGASRVVGAFGQILVTGTTPPVELFGFPDAAAASASQGTPGLTLSTTNATGSSGAYVGTDATIAAFDATSPTTQAFGDAAAVGTAGTAARRDHKHAMMATSASAPSTYETFLAAGNVTIINASTWYSSTELTLTPPAGDWLLIGHASLTSASSALTYLQAGLSSGGTLSGAALTGQTNLAEGASYNPASNAGGQVSVTLMAKAIGLDGSTPVRLAGADSRGASDGAIVKTGISNGVTNKASSLVAIKITSL